MKRLTAIALAFALLLSGCGTEGGAHVPTGDGLTWDEDESRPVVETTAPETSRQELTLVYYPDRSLNPLECTDYTNRTLFSLIYQGLFSVNRDYEAEPQLCSSYAMSEDMKTHVFTIHAATFSDGTALTVNDVVKTLNAAKESTYYGGRFTHITSISATHQGSVMITTDTAFENLPILLDIPILKASELENPQPLGTGPYFLDSTTGGLRLRKRIDWWCNADPVVTAASISLVVAESEAQIRDNFEFADVGLVCSNPCSDSYADYRCDYELWDCENGVFLYLACNMYSEVFEKPEVRAALTYAIDRDALVAEHYRSFARSATLPASPLSPYYDSGLAARYSYDGVKFAQAVTENLLSGTTIKLLVNSEDSLRCRVAKSIAKMISDCGLNVEVVEKSGNAYLTTLNVTRDFDLHLCQTKLSPNMDLSPFFYTYGSLSQAALNDAAIYALCLEALANSGNYYNLHQKVMEDGRLVPILFQSYAVYATRGLLTGLTPARDDVFYYSAGKTVEDITVEMSTVTAIPEEDTGTEE